MPTRAQLVSAYVMAFFYGSAGVMHFVDPGFFLQIVPSVLPFPLLIVYLSGVAELTLGVGLALPKTRHWAAWGVVALLVAVYPANLYHWISDQGHGNASHLPSSPRAGAAPAHRLGGMARTWYPTEGHRQLSVTSGSFLCG